MFAFYLFLTFVFNFPFYKTQVFFYSCSKDMFNPYRAPHQDGDGAESQARLGD